MDLGIIIVWVVIGYIFYKLFSSNSSSKQKKQKRRDQKQPRIEDGYYVRATGRGSSRPSQPSNKAQASYVQVAKRMESMGKYEEASKNYLKGGQIYSAAKMQALIGPNHANNAVNIIRENAGGQYDSILQNLVNEFYYRLNQPATAAALLRGAGKIDEAVAVEIAAGITTTQTTPIAPVHVEVERPSSAMSTSSTFDTEETIQTPVVETEEPKISQPVTASSSNGSYPNTLLMASITLSDPCIVCRKSVNSGESFIHCLNCGKTGHYKHIAEIMKVTGKCPSCKERLVISMYEI